MIARVIWLVLLLAVFTMAAVSAQVGPDAEPVEDEPVVEEAEEAEETKQRESPFVAAAWCTLQSKSEKSDESEEDRPGCDIGVGVSLYKFGQDGRWQIAAAVGSWSFGPVLAYVAIQPKRGPVVAVGIGPLFRYDSRGIERGVEIGIGATFGF